MLSLLLASATLSATSIDLEVQAALQAAVALHRPTAPVPPPKPVEPTRTYDQLRAQAVKEKRPLLVWVGYKCPSSANQLPGLLHHLVSEDRWEGFKGPAVIVGIPDGKGDMVVGEVVKAEDCCASELRSAVDRSAKRMRPSAETLKHIRGWSISTTGACVG